MVDAILGYFRSLFPTESGRKRRATFDDYTRSPKARKMSTIDVTGSHEDDWRSLSSGNSNSSRRTNISTGAKPRLSLLKENVIHIDEDEVEFVKPPSKHASPLASLSNTNGIGQYTSTPNVGKNGAHGDDNDVTFVKCTPAAESPKFTFRKRSIGALKPYSYLSDNNGSAQRRLRQSEDVIISGSSSLRSRFPFTRTSILDQSFQLDEKQQYKELLAKASAATSKSSRGFSFLSKYSTSPMNRGKKLIALAKNKEAKRPLFIDLTNGTAKSNHVGLSTRDTIRKVLDDFDKEKEEVVARDADPDLEIVPVAIPDPKSDIQVERVNSLKRQVEQSQPFKSAWLRNLVEKYKNDTKEREKVIQQQVQYKQKLEEISSEVRSKMLEEQMRKCLHIKDAVLPIAEEKEEALPQLTDDDEYRIDQALNKRTNPNDILSSKFSLNISRRDMLTLDGLNWLNDEVINFYMSMIIERGKKSEWPAAYTMNTFFYPKLLKDGHSSLRRWTRKVDIFAHDFIAVPIHLGMHWCIAIINLKQKVIRYYDSMGGSNNRCLDTLLNYLCEEHMDKKKSKFDTSGWKLENVRDIPQQMNGSDCGMFSCTFAEFVTRNAKINFSQKDMPYLRRKMVLEILNGELLIT